MVLSFSERLKKFIRELCTLAKCMKVTESGHPLSDDPKRQMYIDQRNISHIVTRVWWQGNKLMGEVETAQTAAGKDMKGLIQQKSDVSFSMRGFSKVNRNPNGEIEVTKPLRLIG